MKNLIFLIHFIAIAFTVVPANAQNAGSAGSLQLEIQDTVVYPFFMALKNGNVESFKTFFSVDMYNENKRLLEENTEYPEFLRSYYQGTDISVLKAVKVDGEVEYDVLIKFPNGSQSISKLRVSEEANVDKTINEKKKWKISSMENIR